MGFANSSCSFSRFLIIDPVPDTIINDLPGRLTKFAFKDIEDSAEMQAFGWVSFEDMLESAWETAPPFKGAYAVFSLRLDTRRIPAGVIKKHVALAMKEEKARLAEQNQKFISRERKKELREQVILKLRERFLPVPAEFNVLWNIQANEVWFASVQSKMIDLFMEYFLNSFELHLEQITPYTLAIKILGDAAAPQLDALQATQFIAAEASND